MLREGKGEWLISLEQTCPRTVSAPEGRQELGAVSGLFPTGTSKVSDACREFPSASRTQSPGSLALGLTFSWGASLLPFLFVIQTDPSCPPGEPLLEIPFGQTFLPPVTGIEGVLTLGKAS